MKLNHIMHLIIFGILKYFLDGKFFLKSIMDHWFRIDCLFKFILFHAGTIQISIVNTKYFLRIGFNFFKYILFYLHYLMLKPYG
jgi:hypothetical protein